MTYSYNTETNKIRIYSNGYKLEQGHNSYTMEKFTCEEDALIWAKQYFGASEGEYIELKVDVVENQLTIMNYEEHNLDSFEYKSFHILKGELDYVIYSKELTTPILDVSELEDGIYYYDFIIKGNTDQRLTFSKWENIKFKIKDGVISLL